IYVMRADGAHERNLTNDPAADFLPNWSPDGKRIAWSSGRDGDQEIWAMSRSGRDAIQLTDHPAEDNKPAWSPDGKLIAFHSRRDLPARALYSMAVDGSGVTRLTMDPAYQPDWQPLEAPHCVPWSADDA
ncbi:MAG: PD40 domain-containing protein, partial [Geodermatophilaceae bacterium]|nr:PD40 domain-containing protein [Geodermatophilaceae bacterium]